MRYPSPEVFTIYTKGLRSLSIPSPKLVSFMGQYRSQELQSRKGTRYAQIQSSHRHLHHSQFSTEDSIPILYSSSDYVLHISISSLLTNLVLLLRLISACFVHLDSKWAYSVFGVGGYVLSGGSRRGSVVPMAECAASASFMKLHLRGAGIGERGSLNSKLYFRCEITLISKLFLIWFCLRCRLMNRFR